MQGICNAKGGSQRRNAPYARRERVHQYIFEAWIKCAEEEEESDNAMNINRRRTPPPNLYTKEVDWGRLRVRPSVSRLHQKTESWKMVDDGGK